MRRERHDPSASTPDVTVGRTHHRATVTVTGQVEPATVTAVRAAVRDAAELGVDEVVVDLAGARDGAVLLSGLARSRAETADRGAVLRLEGVALPEFLAALVAAPLDEVFLVYDAVRGETRRRQATGGPAGAGGGRHRSVQRSTDWR